ncbi:hypothetical protein [Enterococcus gallinarum]|uniref:Uncharacterized protein n=1 Tax=Enterococcus gallinarum TaxID=1353 RepID=A0A376GX13_ENTGA|nr:hypothetical protein [Enterococcus gallinarum]STD73148.1 Uncharacterised protein [Enterococcus gallinarum]STD82222.1 Uncharacterised protein [Enterococcus gallinarum]
MNDNSFMRPEFYKKFQCESRNKYCQERPNPKENQEKLIIKSLNHQAISPQHDFLRQPMNLDHRNLLTFSEDTRGTEVASWKQFSIAINDPQVSWVNITASFTCRKENLKPVTRPLLLNFMNDATIFINQEQSIRIEREGVLLMRSYSETPVFKRLNTVKEPFIVGKPKSIIEFLGNVVIGDSTTTSHSAPFIQTKGDVIIGGECLLRKYEGIEVSNLLIMPYGSLEIETKLLSPLVIVEEGHLFVGDISYLYVTHSGEQPAIQIEDGGELTFDQPYDIHIRQTGLGACISPLISSVAAKMSIVAVNSALWLNNNLEMQPTQMWKQELRAMLDGINGKRIAETNSSDFQQSFYGFGAYREFSAGSRAPEFIQNVPQ